ncbi:ESX secretion-associated protein EspG [Kutzneria viridogrisea]|uniref:ESX secretion-associated protein EspG n=2 Tax=Kutzneria TaxID=43356 RepID=W5W547_9PSEU|nr:ESX secretion-associated protein EspG [Kutzneria albida]AHH95586.1 hypothetical protein KALB_2217 [Kutzneria albida DSM 43870]MBA8927052.1 hypothetical protein [Kutzneria viridogrisea]
MSTIVNLSLAAFDVLWEDLRLGSPPYPFEVPSHGQTHDERARIRIAVHADLEQREITYRGQVAPEVAAALTLLARPHLQLDTISTLDVQAGDQGMLRASAVAGGRTAVLAVQEGTQLRLEATRDTALAASLVALLPPTHAGPGQPVSLPARLVGSPVEQGAVGAVTRRTAAALSREQQKALAAMMEPTVLRLGQIGVALYDERGKARRLAGLSWFDNSAGRYFSVVDRGRDGQDWATVSPGDGNRIVYRLGEMIRTASA